jgi:hypothetical protein
MWYIYTMEFYSATDKEISGAWWLMLVILAIWEAEIHGRIMVQGPSEVC